MPAPYGTGTANRERIDHQWNGRSRGANPAITDADWHRVRVVHPPATGEIAVYVDGRRDPLMTAKNTTFGSGRVGFGSFDNVGRMRGLGVTRQKRRSVRVAPAGTAMMSR